MTPFGRAAAVVVVLLEAEVPAPVVPFDEPAGAVVYFAFIAAMQSAAGTTVNVVHCKPLQPGLVLSVTANDKIFSNKSVFSIFKYRNCSTKIVASRQA